MLHCTAIKESVHPAMHLHRNGLGDALHEAANSQNAYVNDVERAEAIVVLAKSLDLGVVAEGTENEAQCEISTSMGCDEMQGYLYGAPVPASGVADLLTAPQGAVCMNDQ